MSTFLAALIAASTCGCGHSTAPATSTTAASAGQMNQATLQAKVQAVQSDSHLSDQQKATIIARLNSLSGSTNR